MRNVEQNWLGMEWKRGDKGIERKKREREEKGQGEDEVREKEGGGEGG